MPTATPKYLARIAGCDHNTIYRVLAGGRIAAMSEELILAVTPAHIRRHPPRYIPARWTRLHLARLLAVPGATQRRIAELSGVSHSALTRIVDGRRETIEPWLAQAIQGVTPAMVRHQSAWVDGKVTQLQLRALQANGWTSEALSEHCGHSVPTLLNHPTREKMRVDVAADVQAMYDDLRDAWGGSIITAKRALARGSRTPDCYDDAMRLIDLDASENQAACRRRLCILALTLGGATTADLAERFDMLKDTVGKTREFVGLRTALGDGVQTVKPGQDDLVAAIRQRLDGISWRERTEVLDDPDVDYAARWAELQTGEWRKEADRAA